MHRTMSSIAIPVVFVLAGCVSEQQAPIETLRAPAGTAAAVADEMDRGNKLFADRNWSGAQEAYAAILEKDPSLAEAHYNLALALERQGDKAEARKHYVQAANLAPGNKIIWNAPPLRKFDQDQELSRKSFMDADPR